MGKKLYVGYDLGDGETITDSVVIKSGELTTKTKFKDMTMPSTKDSGKAIPTIFAFNENGNVIFSEEILANPELVHNIVINFKRCPSDLLIKDGNLSDEEQLDIIKKSSSWPNSKIWSNANTEQMLNFKKSVIDFTNAIFLNDNYQNRLKSLAIDCDEIIFCVGYPTKWSELDAAIYELILKNSILGAGKYAGKKSSLIMEYESRAAFLYSKDEEAFGKLKKGFSVMLIDVGSSTIDITVMTGSANNHQYNSGNNYLGARSIDFIIRDWYLSQIKNQPANWSLYQSLLKNNKTIPNALTLACRKCKEELYSSNNGVAIVHFDLFPGIRLFEKDLDKLIDNTPISQILKYNIGLDDEKCLMLGNKSWKQLFKDFLVETKAEITKKNIKVGHIILTGSASRMPFVPEIILNVFNEVSSNSLIYDMDPSRTISKGLALVGPIDEKARDFQSDLNNIIDNKLENIIKDNIPALGKEMGNVISEILIPKMKKHILSWKKGDIKTLQDMNNKIKDDCSEANLTKLLSNNPSYLKAIEKWLKDKVGKDIAVELKELCKKYGVNDISIEDLNIMTTPKVKIGSLPINPLEFIDTIGAVIAVISGIIAAVSVTTIMAVIVVVISLISQSLAATLFISLVSMGPTGWAILAVIVGVSVAVLIAKGFDNFKSMFKDKVMTYNLPKIARKAMNDEKIKTCFSNANIPEQIEKAFKNEDLQKDIAKKVSLNLKSQVRKRAEDIKYSI